MKGRTPTSDEKAHMSKVAALGCICCLNEMGVQSPAEIHHIDGKTKPGAHYHVLPLCYLHHRAGVDCDEYTSRHPDKRRFERRYGTEIDLLHIVLGML